MKHKYIKERGNSDVITDRKDDINKLCCLNIVERNMYCQGKQIKRDMPE